MLEIFEQNLRLARQNLEITRKLINQEPKNPSSSSSELLMEMFSQIYLALEELHIAQEELEEQNRQLLTTRQEMDDKCEFYQSLFDFAPCGYLVTNFEGVIQKANYAIEDMLSVPCRFLVGKPLIVFIPKEERSQFHLQISEFTSNRQLPIARRINLKPRLGKAFPAEISLVNQKNERKNVTRLLWLIRNLS